MFWSNPPILKDIFAPYPKMQTVSLKKRCLVDSNAIIDLEVKY